ncbi:DnaJ of sub C member 19, partial [Cladochytrium tenue]
MATAVLIGAGVAAVALVGRAALNASRRSAAAAAGAASTSSSARRVPIGSSIPPNAAKLPRGGFEPTMSRREAALILGLRETAGAVPRDRLKDAHRRIMLSNHPDRGGSPYLASKINEAK